MSIGKLKAVHTATHPARLQPCQASNVAALHPGPQPTADALPQALAADADRLIGSWSSATYTYDELDRLTAMALNGVGQYCYSYDANGNRTRRTAGSSTTNLAYPASTDTLLHYDLDGKLIAELDPATKQVKREIIWLGEQPVALIAGATPTQMVSGTNAPALYYVHADHLNTPRMVTDTAGGRRWDWGLVNNEPFGATAPNEAPQGQATAQQFAFNLRFPGQYLDKETGISYNYYRNYNPVTGRYLQSDPIGLQGGLNTYAYVGANPLSFIDPEGLAACTVLFPDYPVEYADGKTSTWLGGHGGVLGYDSSGVTQYYEYGRYRPNISGIVGARLPADEGNVRRVSVPNLLMGKDGQPTPESLGILRAALSKKAGKGTEAELRCDAKADEKKVYEYAISVANNQSRPKYNWKPWSAANHCHTFAKDAFKAGQ